MTQLSPEGTCQRCGALIPADEDDRGYGVWDRTCSRCRTAMDCDCERCDPDPLAYVEDWESFEQAKSGSR